VERNAEPDRRDEHEPAHELGMPYREVHGDAPAERVAENQGRRDPKAGHGARDVVGELRDVRVGRLQRRAKREAGQIDHMHRPAKMAKGADLGRERAPVGGDPRKDDRVRRCAAAPTRHAEAVSITRGHLHPHP
jgi:hypothetical protein